MNRKYVNNELIHWTGRGSSENEAFSTMETICEEKVLRLSYCPNYDKDNFKPRSAMVCFTDIPIKYSREHCNKFGKFGIAFRKDRMIEYGANPAMYTTRYHFERIKKLSNLVDRMLDLEKDREWKDAIEPYIFTEDQTLALKEVSELLQEYSHRNEDTKEYATYYQREWRLTFNSLDFSGGVKPHQEGTTCFYIRNGKPYEIFKFVSMDVAYIVVPIRYWLRAKKISKKLKCKIKIHEFSVFSW